MKKDKGLFEGIYEKPNAIWTKKKPPKELSRLVEQKIIKPCKAIDIACGEGYYSIYLASKGFDVIGIDISENALKYARKNADKRNANVRFLQIDVENLRDLDEKFDFALEWGFLHHLAPAKRKDHIKNIARLLNKNGKYLSTCFNVEDQEFGGCRKKYRTNRFGTILYFSSQDELRNLFKPYFSIIEEKLIKTGNNKAGISHIDNYFFMKKK